MPSRPTIALFSGYYPSHGGGIEIVSGELAKGLSRRGHKVLWCALDDHRPPPGSLVSRRPLGGSDIFYRLTGTPMPFPTPSALRQIWNTVGAADVVLIAEANFMTNALAFVAARASGRPVLLAQHLGVPSTASRFSRLLTFLSERCVVRPMLRTADDVVFVSPAVQSHFRGVRTRNEPIVIGHGVDTDLFRPPLRGKERAEERFKLGLQSKSRVACFVGRCTPSKGVEVLAEIARCRPDWTFLVAGSGPVDPAAWELANVRALGHLDPARLASLYRASDLLILPSPSESFSLVVREALACGTRVLCGDSILLTDPNLKKHVEAAKVDLDRTRETALRFAEALDRPGGEAGAGAAYVARTCSWDKIVSRYAAMIDGLAADRRSANLAVAT